MKGGIPIYPGGYGCVFKPQLKCSKSKNKKNKTRKPHNTSAVSKLLFKKYADIEMHNIQKFHHALKKIPKSHKYFLFTKTTICSPAKISSRDLQGFDEMCSNFTSHGVNESNINAASNIRNLRAINMPNAGISINEWLFLEDKKENKENKETGVVKPLTTSRVKTFNKIISKLVVNAIAPMNRQGVIHNDMKEDNILIRSTSPTIIDWGISGISSREHPIPEVIMNRYISISNPFSSILFTTEFGKNYSEFLKQNDIRNADHVANMRSNPQFIQKLRDFSLAQYLKNKEYGHYSQIQTFFINVFNAFNGFPNSSIFSELSQDDIPDTKSPDELYHTIASNYISDVLLHFTEFDERDGVVRFQYVAYFTTTYIFNCDIWGTVFCYSVFFYFQDAYKYDAYIGIPLSVYSHFLRSILSMYMKQVMINGHEKINVSKLAKLVTSLL